MRARGYVRKRFLAGGSINKGVAAARRATQKAHIEQHCLSSDFGACRPQSFAAASFAIWAQQPVLICGAAARAGIAAKASDQEIARQKRSRAAIRIGRTIGLDRGGSKAIPQGSAAQLSVKKWQRTGSRAKGEAIECAQ